MTKKIKNCFISLLLLCSIATEAKLVPKLELRNDMRANVLIFISKDCPCSKGNLDYINKLAIEYSDFHFIAVHSMKKISDDQILEYLKDKKLIFDVVNDSDLKIADTYHALKTPHAFILRGKDIIYNGGITNTTRPENAKEYYLKEALENILKNELPTKAETRTLGCFIVR
jgi:hypothetical protein